MSTVLTNLEFLNGYRRGGVESVILPKERLQLEKRLIELTGEQAQIVSNKVEVAGGDDWHDGAFRATDNAAKIVVAQAGKLGSYLKSTIVGYPDPSERRATLGSRVTLDQSGERFTVDIVGVPLVYEPDESGAVTACSIESLMAKGIVGQQVGHVALLHVGVRDLQTEVIAVDQEAIKNF